MRIFAEVPSGRGRQTTVKLSMTFLAISVATSLETFERRPTLSALCSQRSTRKPCCVTETAWCRCKIRYVSKFTAASRGSPCDSTAFLFFLVVVGLQ